MLTAEPEREAAAASSSSSSSATTTSTTSTTTAGGDRPEASSEEDQGPEFDPRLDLIAPAIGLVGLVAAGINAGDPAWLSVARMVVGAAFLGAVSDAMLLGHWYLVQPGLRREPLVELVKWTGVLWLPEVVLFLVPVGMVSVWTGEIDDGYAGMLGWFWGACVVTTIGLVAVTLGRPPGTPVLGRHGRHRPAVPGDPDRVRYRSRRPGFAQLTANRRSGTLAVPGPAPDRGGRQPRWARSDHHRGESRCHERSGAARSASGWSRCR